MSSGEFQEITKTSVNVCSSTRKQGLFNIQIKIIHINVKENKVSKNHFCAFWFILRTNTPPTSKRNIEAASGRMQYFQSNSLKNNLKTWSTHDKNLKVFTEQKLKIPDDLCIQYLSYSSSNCTKGGNWTVVIFGNDSHAA